MQCNCCFVKISKIIVNIEVAPSFMLKHFKYNNIIPQGTIDNNLEAYSLSGIWIPTIADNKPFVCTTFVR